MNYGNCSLVNCTLTGTSAQYNGGAIDNVGGGATLDVTQCTILGNSAGGAGGGIDNYQAQLNVANSIIADNGTDLYNWDSSYITIYSNNIFNDIVPGGIFTVAGTFMVVDPMLGPLANNGGPTFTMLPQAGSPAINNGVTSFAAGINYDQRGPGFPRVVGTAVDIGAVEVQVIIAPAPSLLIGERRTNGVFGFWLHQHFRRKLHRFCNDQPGLASQHLVEPWLRRGISAWLGPVPVYRPPGNQLRMAFLPRAFTLTRQGKKDGQKGRLTVSWHSTILAPCQ